MGPRVSVPLDQGRGYGGRGGPRDCVLFRGTLSDARPPVDSDYPSRGQRNGTRFSRVPSGRSSVLYRDARSAEARDVGGRGSDGAPPGFASTSCERVRGRREKGGRRKERGTGTLLTSGVVPRDPGSRPILRGH